MSNERTITHQTRDRQWDIRVNIQSDDDLLRVTEGCMEQYATGKLRYVLIGGPEIGTKPTHSDYQVRHVHICAIFTDNVTKGAVLCRFNIKEGNGYYMVPRNRDLPYKGWRDHHIKEFSKIDETKTIVYEAGELPKDVGEKRITKRSEAEKKETTATVLKNLKALLMKGMDDEAFEYAPRNFLLYGERLKAAFARQKKPITKDANPHLWIHGFPGTGKTAIMQFIYPRTYPKDLNNRFFDLYNEKDHDHIMLEDLDHTNVEKLGIQFLKTLCDEKGFPIDQKYKSPQPTVATILVTSNFTINEVVPEGKGVDETKMALHRRFVQLRVDNLYRLVGLKLIPKYERTQLKLAKNNDYSKLFMTWDYLQDMPLGNEVLEPYHYQNLIRNAFFH